MTASAAVASSGGAPLSLLPAAQLLVDGRVRVVGVWPRGCDVDVHDGERVLRVVERHGDWSCPCGAEGCAHRVAAALVVPVRGAQ